MWPMQISPFVKYGLIFAAIPMVSTYALGHVFKALFLPDLESMANMPAEDPDAMNLPLVEYIFPFAVFSLLIALACWFVFMRKRPSLMKGVVAGGITVFVSYPILGFLIGFIYPHLPGRFESALNATLTLSVIGNFLTVWLTYPLGVFFGGLIGDRLLKSLRPKIMTEFD